MDWEHSEYCQKINDPQVDNTEYLYDINKEVKNYKSFRKYLNEYLNSNPLVSYKIFYIIRLNVRLKSKKIL